MATIQCPKCGANQDEGTHCNVCGAPLDSSPQDTKDQYKEPAKTTENVDESATNTEKAPLDTTKEPIGVIIQKKNNGLLFLLVILVCLGLSVTVSYILNHLPNSTQNVETAQTEPVEPPLEPQPEVKVPPTTNQPDFDNLKKKVEAMKQWDNTHDMIVEKVSWHSNLLFNEEDSKNTKHVQSEIEALIKKNQCKRNAEDIIVAIEGDVKNAQKLIKKIDYKQLYLLFLNKHLGGYRCSTIDYSARLDWGERENTLFLNNSKWSNNPQNTVTTCSNDNMRADENVLNISVEFNILNEPNEQSSLREISLGWGDPSDKYFRFYDDFVIDPYVLVDNSKKTHTFSDVKIHENGRIILFNSALDINDFIKQSTDVSIVYGRFIPDPSNNATYFVLSYRTYSISETYSCYDLHQYIRSLFPPPQYDPDPNDFRPKDALVDLPF